MNSIKAQPLFFGMASLVVVLLVAFYLHQRDQRTKVVERTYVVQKPPIVYFKKRTEHTDDSQGYQGFQDDRDAADNVGQGDRNKQNDGDSPSNVCNINSSDTTNQFIESTTYIPWMPTRPLFMEEDIYDVDRFQEMRRPETIVR